MVLCKAYRKTLMIPDKVLLFSRLHFHFHFTNDETREIQQTDARTRHEQVIATVSPSVLNITMVAAVRVTDSSRGTSLLLLSI